LSVKFTLGGLAAATANTRACALRVDEAAVRTGDHLNLDFASCTVDVWCRIESWPKSAAATLPLSLVCGNNFEVLASNPTGTTLRLIASFRVQDAAGAESVGSITTVDIAATLGTTWHLLTVQFELIAGRACLWWDGVVKGTLAGLTSPLERIYVKRKYLGLMANTSGADVMVDAAPTIAGVISFDNWRVSRSARYTHNTAFAVPTVSFTDTGSPAYGLWKLREATVPNVLLSSFGEYNGARPRIDAFADRYAASWSAVWNSTPNPVT
jgi:hypothetical protein